MLLELFAFGVENVVVGFAHAATCEALGTFATNLVRFSGCSATIMGPFEAVTSEAKAGVPGFYIVKLHDQMATRHSPSSIVRHNAARTVRGRVDVCKATEKPSSRASRDHRNLHVALAM